MYMVLVYIFLVYITGVYMQVYFNHYGYYNQHSQKFLFFC